MDGEFNFGAGVRDTIDAMIVSGGCTYSSTDGKVTVASILEAMRSFPEAEPATTAFGISAEVCASLPKSSATPGSQMFGIPVVVITPEIQSQIDGIQAFRAANGEPKAQRFGFVVHEGIPVVIPMED